MDYPTTNAMGGPFMGLPPIGVDILVPIQMDATKADIYLVSRFDRSSVIGRPNIYLAVDSATQLITGIYVGLEIGENAVMACLSNAASDKVVFCSKYGIEIDLEQWPSRGIPEAIITDKVFSTISFSIWPEIWQRLHLTAISAAKLPPSVSR